MALINGKSPTFAGSLSSESTCGRRLRLPGEVSLTWELDAGTFRSFSIKLKHIAVIAVCQTLQPLQQKIVKVMGRQHSVHKASRCRP